MTLEGKDDTPGKTPRDENWKNPQYHRSRSRHHHGSPSHSPHAGGDSWLQDLMVGCHTGARLILGQLRRRLHSPGFRDHASSALVDILGEDAAKWPQIVAEFSSRHSGRPDCEITKIAAEMVTPIFEKLSRCLRTPAVRTHLTGEFADALELISGLLGPEDDEESGGNENGKETQHHRSRFRHHHGSTSHSPNAGDYSWLQDLLVGGDTGARLILGQLRRRLRSPGFRDHASVALVDSLAADADNCPQIAAEFSSRHSGRPDSEAAKMAAEMATPIFAKLSRSLRTPAVRTRLTGGIADALQFVSELVGPEDDDQNFGDGPEDGNLDYVKLGVSELMKRPVKVVRFLPFISGQRCALCHNDFVPGDQVKTLPCSHELHLTCLITLLRQKAALRSKTCPTCGNDLKD